MKKRLFSLALASVMALSLARMRRFKGSSHRGRDKGRNRADSRRHFCQG
ncbi:MAG: hypothetical protein ACLTBV_06785 [Enterocloster bolteae]